MKDDQIKTSIYESIKVEINPIVIQLQEFGYDNVYSRRVYYYLHPEDIDEALNYMSFENGIIQHQFVKDRRNISNKKCYICNENEEIHLKELDESLNNNSYSKNKEEEKEEREEEKQEINEINLNQIKKSVNDINTNSDNYDLKSSFIPSRIKSSMNTNVNKNNNSESFIRNSDENNNQVQNSINSIDEIKFNKKNLESEIKILKTNLEIEEEDKNEIFEIKPKIKLKLKEEKECEICNENFIINEFNKLENCGHSFCSSCWYDSLSVKIKENKLSFIKCLDYNCQEKLPDYFIVNILKGNNDLLKIYNRYKLELEVIENPNKKLCPYPNCDSYLELKNIHNKDVSCLNNHTFCFLCLKQPHGNLPCNGNDLDKSVIEYAKNNFVKRCPKCNIIIEKNKGCNHITCTKCGYQWCWLCNEQYNENHFNEGKCKGFQFFQPKNDYDIKLAMEGKINANELSNSQRQFEDDFPVEIVVDRIDHIHIHHDEEEEEEEIRHHPENNEEIRYQYINCNGKILINLIFLFFGYSFVVLINVRDRIFLAVLPMYILFSIVFFIQLFYFNFISFILILIFMGYKRFIVRFKSLDEIYFKKVVLIMYNSLFLIFSISYNFCKKRLNRLNHSNRKGIKLFVIFPYLFMTTICFFSYNILFNIFAMILSLIDRRNVSSFFNDLEDMVVDIS